MTLMKKLKHGLSALACLGLGATAAQADGHAAALDKLATEAAGGPAVSWYESSKEDQIEGVIDAFNATYPDIKVQHVRVVGGNKMAGRVVQEIQGQGYTADLVTAGSAQIWQLNERGYLLSRDWSELGVSGSMTPTDFTVAIAASVYVVLVNTDKVAEADVPQNWADLLDPKWEGKIGTWVRAGAFAQMAKMWGKDKAREELDKMVALKPFLFKSTFPMAQQVAAGEVDVALGFFHTAEPPIAAGAPIQRIALDPTPLHTIYTSVTKDGKNTAGAQVFLSWLTSAEGAAAYEAATNRGSHLIDGTRTQKLIAGRSLSEFPANETDEYRTISAEFNEVLGKAGNPI